MANFKRNSIELMVSADSIFSVIAKAMALVAQVAVILQVVAFNMLRFFTFQWVTLSLIGR
jgi:hypothetical protein|tara:strand:+ start:654 stop:833 length:180 start_codon:yes stop_codon:yes gene_type:complete